jgi:hypothetical protein
VDGELAVIGNGLDNEDPGICAAQPSADGAGEADVVGRLAIVLREQLVQPDSSRTPSPLIMGA